MRDRKRIISIILVISLIVTQLPTNVIASNVEQIESTQNTPDTLQQAQEEEIQKPIEGVEEEKPVEESKQEDVSEISQTKTASELLEDEQVEPGEDGLQSNLPEKEINNKSVIKDEIIEKREINVKHFIKDDNTFEAVVYPTPVHYLKDNKWHDIDNTLISETDKDKNIIYRNKDNDVKVNIHKKMKDNNFIKISKDKYEVEWNVVGANKVDGVEVNQDLSKFNKLDENTKKKTLLNLSSTIAYEDALDNIDFEYNIVPNGLKESIIMNTSENIEQDFSITYEFKIKNLEIIKNDDNSILFYDINNKENIIFKLDSPFMYDALGEMSNDIPVIIERGKDTIVITYVPDNKWIKAPERQYPIIIDPTIGTSIDSVDIMDAHVSEGFPSTNYKNSAYLKSGYGSSSFKNRTYMKFTLPTLTSADTITNAELELSLASTKAGTSTEVDLHKVTGTWNSSTITWNNQPSYNSSIIEDYDKITSNQGLYHWEITKMVTDWYTTGVNNGLMIKNKDEKGTYIELYSSDTASGYQDFRPIITLAYINNSGLESYWSYHSQDLGRAGTGNVNDYNGNLVFLHPDVSTSGNRMPISINHVYNSNNSSDMGFGKGWRLNLSQTVNKTTINNVTYCVYTDEDGTIHYLKDIGNAKYEDEEGINLILNENTASLEERYIIKDKQDNSLVFDSTGKLKLIKDNNNNRIQLNYTNNLLSSIIDGVDRAVTLTYSDGKLTKITDPSGRANVYNYSLNNLTSITYPDGAISKYNYDSFFKVENIDGYQINYVASTNSPKRVIGIEESNKDGTLGDLTNISYGKGSTTFTDLENRKTNYQFNNLGNTISIKNDEGYAQYYKYIELGKNINRIDTASKLQKTTINLLKDHNVESNIGAWTYDNVSGMGQGTSATNEKYFGDHSLKLTKSDTQGGNYFDQTVTLEKGKTYTFSSYVKLNNVSLAQGNGAGIEVIYKDKNGIEKLVRSKKINGTKDWNRIQLTFELPADAQSDRVVTRVSLVEASGEAYYDCMQLEGSSIANRYNLVENQDANGITSSPYNWVAQGWSSSDLILPISDSRHPISLNNNVFKIDGDTNNSLKKFSQQLNISGKKGDVFTFASWAMANSVPKGKFAIEAIINSSTPQQVTFNFNGDSSEWQYLSEKFIANNDYSSIDIYLIYENNSNTAYFDGVQLYKEEFGDSYQYDSKGNIISTVDLNKKESTFEYNGNNDLIKSIDPKGSNFKYEYDASHNITKGTSSTHLVSTFEYDQYGNPISAGIGNGSTSIKSLAKYKDNGNYIQSISDNLGNTETYDYDSIKGVLNSVSDEKGSKTTNEYDPLLDQLKIVSKNLINSDGSTSTIANSYEYNSDRIAKITHNGFDYNFNYDSLGNSTSVSVGLQNLITNIYQSRTSKLLESIYGNGQKIGYDYDDQDRLTSIKVKGEKDIDITYSAHVSDEGWQAYKSNGEQSGTIDGYKSIQALKINLTGETSGINIKYQAHVENIGWQDWVYDGSQIGTTGLNKRMEAIRIKMEGAPKGYRVRYQVYVKELGWMDPVEDGAMAGTIGLSLPIEAIRIDVAKVAYSYEYNAEGNLGRITDIVNDTSYIYAYDSSGRLTQIEDEKGSTLKYEYDENNNSSKVEENISGKSYATNFSYDEDNRPTEVNYQRESTSTKVNYLHNSVGQLSRKIIDLTSGQFITDYNYKTTEGTIRVGYQGQGQSYGWQGEVVDGDICGTTNQNKRLEGIRIDLKNAPSGVKIKYQAHVQDIGWQNWVYDGALAGTEAQSKRMEGIKIQLEGAPQGYHVQYQAYVTSVGWQEWVMDGALAGTTLQGVSIEAIRIKIVKDASTTNGGTDISYLSEVQDKGWETISKKNGEIGGTTGQALRLEAIRLNLISAPEGAQLKYEAHVQDIGWQGEKNANEIAGTVSQNKRMEAIKIYLLNAPGYHVEYQVHISGIGWQDVVKDGQIAGTTGQQKAIEGIRVSIVKDGETVTSRLYSITNGDKKINYTYDNNGNIKSIIEEGKEKTYQYNELDEVIRENDQVQSKTITYSYDMGGNIISKKEYPYNIGNLDTPTKTINYSYGDTNWKDKLTAYNGKAITYDEIGNPLTYDGHTYTWEQGRNLKSINKTGLSMSFKYNDNGIQTEKTVNGTTTSYHLVGDKVTFETNGTDKIYYTYDSSDNLISMNLNGIEYYYIRNAQNDIIGLIDNNRTQVASYTYDTWGKLISIKDQNGTDITNVTTSVGYKNSYRYRGYRYDTETGLYYLQSRYYNPAWGRIINADDTNVLTASLDELTDKNLFAYCDNNPIMREDNGGDFWGLALAGGGALGASWTFGGANFWNPVGWIVIGVATIATIGYVGYRIYKMSAKPIGKVNRKKQNREVNEKKRKDSKFKSRSNKDPNRSTKKHTPKNQHQKNKK